MKKKGENVPKKTYKNPKWKTVQITMILDSNTTINSFFL